MKKMTADEMTRAAYVKMKKPLSGAVRSDDKAFVRIKRDPEYRQMKTDILKQLGV